MRWSRLRGYDSVGVMSCSMALLCRMRIIIAIFGLAFIPFFASAQSLVFDEPSSMSSSVTTGGNGASIGWLNYEISGIKFAYDYLSLSNIMLVSSSTPYTILGVRVINQAGYVSYGNEIDCGEMRDYSFFDHLSSLASETSGASSYSDDNFIHCTEDAVFSQSGGSGIVVIAYVPYDTRMIVFSDIHGISFGLAVIIVILFLMVVGMLWNKLFKTRPWL